MKMRVLILIPLKRLVSPLMIPYVDITQANSPPTNADQDNPTQSVPVNDEATSGETAVNTTLTGEHLEEVKKPITPAPVVKVAVPTHWHLNVS
jgi:hypothetical protein